MPEKLVISRVSFYLNSHNHYNTCQSAYRPGHNTEIVLLKVVNDLLHSHRKSNIYVLALLDFSSAFDTIDHSILVHRLNTDFGFTDTVLQWSSSYMTDRTQYVSLSNHSSAFAHVHSGFLKVQFMAIYFSPCILSLCLPLSTNTLSYTLQLMMTYNYRCLLPQTKYLSYSAQHTMQSCISDVKAWVTVNMPKLNDNKTELMLVTSKRTKHLHILPTFTCTSGRCNRLSEFTLLHFTIFQ